MTAIARQTNKALPDNRDDQGSYTVEEVSLLTQISARNIRAFQEKGLLAPPLHSGGRSAGRYSDDHLARIRLIKRLQGSGFSLEAIRQMLLAWESGRSLSDLMGMEKTLAEGLAEEPGVFSASAVAQLLGKPADIEQRLQQCRELGLIEAEGEHYRVPYPRLLEIAAEAANAGAPLDAILAEAQRSREAIRRLANRYTKIYEANAWRPFINRGAPGEELPALANAVNSMRRLGNEALQLMLSRELEQAIDEGIRRYSRALTGAAATNGED